MAALSDLAQKAFFLGVGLASMAADKAASSLGDIREQAQKLAQELVERGEMNTEQAQKFVNDMMQQGAGSGQTQASSESGSGPVKIDIEDEGTAAAGTIELSEAAQLRQQIEAMQAELDRLRSR